MALVLNLGWLPHNTHTKASSFQELVFIIKVIFDVKCDATTTKIAHYCNLNANSQCNPSH